MLSLRDRIIEASQIIDLGDRKPVQLAKDSDLIDSSITVVSDSPLRERVALLLNSNANAQVVWALNNMQKLALSDDTVSLARFVPTLIKFMSSDNYNIEYYSVYCCSILSKVRPSSLGDVTYLFKAALDRAKVFPAIEYGYLVINLMNLVTDQTIIDTLIPALLSMIKMNDSYQHFVGYVFSFFPFDRVSSEIIGPEIFTSKFYLSMVILTTYLPQISKNAMRSFGNQWFTQTIPQQLLTISNIKESIRPAATKTVISFLSFLNSFNNNNNNSSSNNFYNNNNNNNNNMNGNNCGVLDDKSIFMFLSTAFSWATTNDEVCLTLLKSANELLSKRKDKFQQKFIDVAVKLCQTTNFEIRKQIPSIFANVPSVFANGYEHQLKSILKKFLKETSNNEIRLEFLKSLPTFYKNYTSNYVREMVIRFFSQFFNDTNNNTVSNNSNNNNNNCNNNNVNMNNNESIMNNDNNLNNFVLNSRISEMLMSSPLYCHLGEQMYVNIVPKFISLSSAFINKWRIFEQSMNTFVNSFPDEYFLQFIGSYRLIVARAMQKYTRPLAPSCLLLLTRMCHLSSTFFSKEVSNGKVIENIDWIIKNFRQSTNSAMRSFFISLSASICYSIPIDLFSTYLWQVNIELAEDKSDSVVATLIKTLPKFRKFFHQICEKVLEKQAVSLFSHCSQNAQKKFQSEDDYNNNNNNNNNNSSSNNSNNNINSDPYLMNVIKEEEGHLFMANSTPTGLANSDIINPFLYYSSNFSSLNTNNFNCNNDNNNNNILNNINNYNIYNLSNNKSNNNNSNGGNDKNETADERLAVRSMLPALTRSSGSIVRRQQMQQRQQLRQQRQPQQFQQFQASQQQNSYFNSAQSEIVHTTGKTTLSPPQISGMGGGGCGARSCLKSPPSLMSPLSQMSSSSASSSACSSSLTTTTKQKPPPRRISLMSPSIALKH